MAFEIALSAPSTVATARRLPLVDRGRDGLDEAAGRGHGALGDRAVAEHDAHDGVGVSAWHAYVEVQLAAGVLALDVEDRCHEA